MKLQGNTGKLEILISKRNNSETSDYWDGNWLESAIRIDVSGFKALYGASLRVDDMQSFYKGIVAIQKGNAEEAEFTNMEDGLYLHFKLEVNGEITCNGKATNEDGNMLQFILVTDLASLDIFVGELAAVLNLYPLVG